MIKRTLYIIVFLIHGLCSAVYAQRQVADSLRQLLTQTKDPKLRVDLLCQLSYDLVYFNDSEAKKIAAEALELARKIDYKEGIKYALTVSSLDGISTGEYRKALQYLREARQGPAWQRKNLSAYNFMLTGSAYRDLAYYDSAEFFYIKALAEAGKEGDPYYLGFIYRGLAHLNIELWNNNKALKYLDSAEHFALKRKGDYYVLMNIWDLYGRVYRQMLNYKQSDQYYLKMASQEKNTSDFQLRIKYTLHQSDSIARTGDLSAALQKAFEALQMSDIYKYPQQRVDVYYAIGFIYSELSQYALSSEYYYEGLKIAENLGFRNQTARLYCELAWIFKEEKNFKLAYDYLNKAEKLFTEIKDRNGLSSVSNIRGLILYLERKYPDAIKMFDQALQIRESIGNEIGIAASMFNKALVFEAQGKDDQAIDLQRKSLKIEERLDNKVGMGLSYNGVASILIKMKRFREAEDLLDKALELSYVTGSKLMRRVIYLNYSLLAEAKGDFKKALYHRFKYEALHDSIYSESVSVKLAEMQALYQVEKKENEIRELDRQKRFREEELASQKALADQQKYIIWISLTAIGLLIVMVLIGFQYVRSKVQANKELRALNAEIVNQKERIQEQSEELLQANQTISSINKSLEGKIDEHLSELRQAYKELDTFFYRTSHDFRRPLTTFLGLAEVGKITVKDKNALELFDKIRETASNLDKMLYKLQSISDFGSQQIAIKEVFAEELLRQVLDSFREEIMSKAIKVSLVDKCSGQFYSYPVLIKTIFENLIENSIQFSSVPNPYIHIVVTSKQSELIFEVEDNGQGIAQEYYDRIFEMYFRANERSRGNGLGLYIVKKAVEKLNGKIEFRSAPNQGSFFKVTLPSG